MEHRRSWRLLAFLASALYLLLCLAVIALLLRNLGWAIAVGLTAGLLAAGAWLVLTGSKVKRATGWPLTILAATALLVELGYFVSVRRNRWAMVLVAGLSVAYLALLAMLRARTGRQQRHEPVSISDARLYRTPYLIINPKSGNGRALKAGIPELAERQGIHTVMLQKGDEVGALAAQAAAGGADVLGISGGDGSIGAVAAVALKHDLPLVVLPGGTRCHFARDIGLEPERIVDALDGFNGIERRIDIGSINGRTFLNNASFGMYADIVDHPNYREHKARVSRQVLQALARGEKPPYELHFGYHGQNYTQAIEILVGVNRYETVNVFELGQRTRLDEGILQIIAVLGFKTIDPKQLLRGLLSASVMREQQEVDVLQWADQSFRLTSTADSLVVGVDGEREEYHTPITVWVLPRALRLLVAPDVPMHRSPKKLSPKTISQLWRA